MTNELAVKTEYAITKMDAKDLAAVISDAAGANGLSPQDLDRVKIPSGGGLAWEITTLEGVESVKDLMGIIIHHQDARAYWSKQIEEAGGNQPPDCSSTDGIRGVGAPGGECATCPLAQFGSDRKGRGQGCKAAKIIYMAVPENILPISVVMAPTSIKPMRQYLIRLAGRALRASQVVTSISLEKQKNSDGITYARAVPVMKEVLAPETASKVAQYAEAFKSALGSVSLKTEDVE
jgi:hypothetical protein